MTTRISFAAAFISCFCVIGPGTHAQDRDEFYAIARGDRGARPAAAQPQTASRGFGFPGFSLFGANRRDVPEITVRPQQTPRPQISTRERPGIDR